jgi:hypothetical protein
MLKMVQATDRTKFKFGICRHDPNLHGGTIPADHTIALEVLRSYVIVLEKIDFHDANKEL